jgi:hypothetical protein
MSLIQFLPDGPLDIVGDIHGELTALASLLRHLGYDRQGRHPDGRKLVFIGDLCDRGPDSVGVIEYVQQLVENGNARAILGNHEINLLANDAKDGSGWFFEERTQSDQAFYAPFCQALPRQRDSIRRFFEQTAFGAGTRRPSSRSRRLGRPGRYASPKRSDRPDRTLLSNVEQRRAIEPAGFISTLSG